VVIVDLAMQLRPRRPRHHPPHALARSARASRVHAQRPVIAARLRPAPPATCSGHVLGRADEAFDQVRAGTLSEQRSRHAGRVGAHRRAANPLADLTPRSCRRLAAAQGKPYGCIARSWRQP
jgi:hypothetical protein